MPRVIPWALSAMLASCITSRASGASLLGARTSVRTASLLLAGAASLTLTADAVAIGAPATVAVTASAERPKSALLLTAGTGGGHKSATDALQRCVDIYARGFVVGQFVRARASVFGRRRVAAACRPRSPRVRWVRSASPALQTATTRFSPMMGTPRSLPPAL